MSPTKQAALIQTRTRIPFLAVIDSMVVPFDVNYLMHMLVRAFIIHDIYDRSMIDTMLEQVLVILGQNFNYVIPASEDIEDIIDAVLIANNQGTAARMNVLRQPSYEQIVDGLSCTSVRDIVDEATRESNSSLPSHEFFI